MCFFGYVCNVKVKNSQAMLSLYDFVYSNLSSDAPRWSWAENTCIFVYCSTLDGKYATTGSRAGALARCALSPGVEVTGTLVVGYSELSHL